VPLLDTVNIIGRTMNARIVLVLITSSNINDIFLCGTTILVFFMSYGSSRRNYYYHTNKGGDCQFSFPVHV
jgi:hypothetical protein